MKKQTTKSTTLKRRIKKTAVSNSKQKIIKKAKSQTAKSVSYQNYLIDSLKDLEEAAGYLNAALEGGDIDVFLLALKNVVQAHGGISALATKVKKSRTSLYKTISENGNPYLKSANELLTAMGMHLTVVPNAKRTSH